MSYELKNNLGHEILQALEIFRDPTSCHLLSPSRSRRRRLRREFLLFRRPNQSVPGQGPVRGTDLAAERAADLRLSLFS